MGVIVRRMTKDKKLKIVIIVLAILLALSIVALGGTLLYNHFAHSEPASVVVPGNIITPESESGDTTSDAPPSTSDTSDAVSDTPLADKS